jgi:hypothetical protein
MVVYTTFTTIRGGLSLGINLQRFGATKSTRNLMYRIVCKYLRAYISSRKNKNCWPSRLLQQHRSQLFPGAPSSCQPPF